MELIDSYMHCGRSKYEPIESVRRVMSAAKVSRGVIVQHMGEFDNSYIGSIVDADPQHFAGVLLVDHHAPEVLNTLEHWAATKHFQGIRLTMESIASTPQLFVTAGNLGLAVVLFSAEGVGQHLAELETQMKAAPFTRVIVTHLGNPAVTQGHLADAAGDVFRLAEFPNVYFQVSGMKMFCPFPHEPLYPLIDEAVDRFGVDRMLWGSNYPVVGSEQDYRADLQLLLDGRLPVPRDAIAKVAGENARRLWFPHAT
jgi:L-fuconolactonase